MMGEIADMMLDGFLDEETGELIDGDAPGFPRRMSDPDCYFSPHAPLAVDPVPVTTRAARRRRQRQRKRAAAAAAKAKSPP